MTEHKDKNKETKNEKDEQKPDKNIKPPQFMILTESKKGKNKEKNSLSDLKKLLEELNKE